MRKNNWMASGFGKNISPDLIDDKYLDVEIIILLQGTNMFGDTIYSYLKINGANLKKMFALMQKNENFKPADFGTVLAAGRDMPSAEVRAEMAETHKMVEVPVPQPPKPVFAQPKFFGDEDAE